MSAPQQDEPPLYRNLPSDVFAAQVGFERQDRHSLSTVTMKLRTPLTSIKGAVGAGVVGCERAAALTR